MNVAGVYPSLFQRMLCHLLIAEKTIEHIIRKKRAILNYFRLFCDIYFLVLEIFIEGKKDKYFSSVQKPIFFLFVHFPC